MKRLVRRVAASLVLLVMVLFGGGYMLLALRALLPAIRPGIYWPLFLLANLCIMLVFSHIRIRMPVWLGQAAEAWSAVALSVFFMSVPVITAYVLFVPLFHVLPARTFDLAALASFCALLLLDLYGLVNARSIRVRRFDRHVAKASGRKTLHIVHLSDLHLGYTANLKAMQGLVERVNALCPDIICITGDTFTESTRYIHSLDAIARIFRNLKAPLGVYACLGNHDAGPDFPQMLAFFDAAGVHLLRDEAVTLPGGITLAGRLDRTPGERAGARLSPKDLLSGRDLSRPAIVMDHQPAQIEAIRETGADLLLCGHTHGGEFFPIHLFVRRFFPHYYGALTDGGLLTLVSPGSYAALPPMRIGSHAEIFDITLTFSGGFPANSCGNSHESTLH